MLVLRPRLAALSRFQPPKPAVPSMKVYWPRTPCAYTAASFSVAAQSSGTRRAEVYDPRTRSSLVKSFAKSTLATPTTSRGRQRLPDRQQHLRDRPGCPRSAGRNRSCQQLLHLSGHCRQGCQQPQRLSENFRQQHRQHPVQSVVYPAGQQNWREA